MSVIELIVSNLFVHSYIRLAQQYARWGRQVTMIKLLYQILLHYVDIDVLRGYKTYDLCLKALQISGLADERTMARL